MKPEELRELDAEELGGRLKGARRELYELRFKIAVGQLDNHREIRKARKEIARILTVVHQRRLEAVEPYAPLSDGEESAQVPGGRSEGRAAEAEGEAVEASAPPAAGEIEEEDVESPEVAASEGSAAGAGGAPAAADETEEEAGRAPRRRSRRAVNEDEG